MKVTELALPGVFLVEPKVFGDDRGFFYESFNHARFEQAIGKTVSFVQDNNSCSARNVLRELHYEIKQAPGKLLRVVAGAGFEVAVELRLGSDPFGPWVCEP